MFFELRSYDLKPGKAPVYLEFFRTFGVGLVTRHLPMVGYWMVESGTLNRIEHLWAYADFAERDACRASLATERSWTEDFVPKAFVDVVAQANRFMALDASSPAFDRVVAARRDVHANQPATAPMFASGLHALTVSDAPLAQERCIAGFKVLSGDRPGRSVTLTEGGFDRLTTGNDGVHAHEILRPLAVSPLH